MKQVQVSHRVDIVSLFGEGTPDEYTVETVLEWQQVITRANKCS
jgi:hypothetical protein